MTKETVIGQKIVNTRKMTRDELDRNGWDFEHVDSSLAIVLENGTLIFASRDDEGNGIGALFGEDSNKEAFYLRPHE